MKLKRSTTVPLLLLVYLTVISIYAWPSKNHHITFPQYWATIGVTLVCIIVLSYALKKRDKYRDENKSGKL